ncbi:MAG: DUF819 family protein [Woeseia sp.]|nr:DUF819 family protein [Woeseia sp.]MBT8096269.1 DUF819 family protein [Woeseia sp.]NNL55341.1 DUF819 family protein [Woeseia sp.]
MSLIPADQDFAVWAVLFGIAAFGFWSERYPFGRKYSGVMLLITLAIVLSNLRVIPTSAPAYDIVWQYLVPIAIPLLLFDADMRRIFREAGATLIAFIAGSAAVVAGVMVAVTLIDLGGEEPKLAGIFTGTYIGGSLNFAAVAEATQFENRSVLTAAVAADNVITNLHILLIIFLPGVAAFARLYPARHGHEAAPDTGKINDGAHRIANLNVAGLIAAIALAFALAACGSAISAALGRPQYAILLTTALTLIIATFGQRFVRGLSGYNEAGNVLMFVFLASIGASADIWLLIDIAPVLFLFALIIVSVHLLLIFGIGKLLRLDLAEICIASAVCIGGPASAPAIAAAKGWHDLVVPGVLAGSFGYASGSFIGMFVYELLL